LHRRNFTGRGYEGYAYPHFYSGGYCTPTFKRYKRLSFELKVRRNAWAAGALPGPRWGSLQHSPRPLARLRALVLKGRKRRAGKVEERGSGREGGRRGGKGRKGEGKWCPHLLEESYALAQLSHI